MSKADERQERVGQSIGRIRQAILCMRGKYRLEIAPSNRHPADAVRAIRALWSMLGLPDPKPELHGKPTVRDLKSFRGEAFVALELLDEIEALDRGRDGEVAGRLLRLLFERVNRLWRCCVGLKAEQARKAALARAKAT